MVLTFITKTNNVFVVSSDFETYIYIYIYIYKHLELRVKLTIELDTKIQALH